MKKSSKQVMARPKNRHNIAQLVKTDFHNEINTSSPVKFVTLYLGLVLSWFSELDRFWATICWFLFLLTWSRRIISLPSCKTFLVCCNFQICHSFLILQFITRLCLTRTGNYRIHVFDWLKSIYWPRSRFSHLDRFHFTVKKLQTKIQKYWLFSSKKISGSDK